MATKHFEQNLVGRDFVVGDMHGCLSQFERLLEEIKFDRELDRVFSVGDLVDRGPDSFGCLKLIRESWFHTVFGNHEDLMISSYLGHSNGHTHRVNGGGWMYDGSFVENEEFKQLMQLILDLPYVITVGSGETRFNVLHAETTNTDEGLDNGNFGPREIDRMLWGRRRISFEKRHQKFDQGLSITYVGHTVTENICRIGSLVIVDQGACFDLGMTLIEHKTKTFWRTTPTKILTGTIDCLT